jgi:hypothetical protein
MSETVQVKPISLKEAYYQAWDVYTIANKALQEFDRSHSMTNHPMAKVTEAELRKKLAKDLGSLEEQTRMRISWNNRSLRGRGRNTCSANEAANLSEEALIKKQKDEKERIIKEYQASINALQKYENELHRLRNPLYENAVFLFNKMNTHKNIYIKKQQDDIAREKAIQAEVERLSILKEAHQRVEELERKKEEKKLADENAKYLSTYQKEIKCIDSLTIL